MKKLYSFFSLLIVLLFTLFIVGKVNVNAASAVTSVLNNGCDFYVDSVLEEKELDFGVKYHNDWGYTRINDSQYKLGYNAGGSQNSSGDLIIGEYYSQNLNVLEVPTDSGVNIVPFANIKVGTWTLTTVKAFITKYEESHPEEKVIAAINGDFFDINSTKNYPKTSTGSTVTNGNYYKVAPTWKSIGFKNTETGTSMIGNIKPTVSEKPILEVFDKDNNVIYSCDVDHINEAYTGNETSVYFTFYNDKHVAQAENVENAYVCTGDQIVPFSTSSVYGLGEVTLIGNAKISSNQFAVLTGNSDLKSKLEIGTTVRVQYYFTGELAEYDNVIGYPHNLLVNNEVVFEQDNYRHPRTMIGTKEDGTIVMVTADGRRTAKGYYGLAPIEESCVMVNYGCTNAYNLDGGGSTTMVILENGEFVIKNEPSDNSPRSDGNCLLITVKVPTLDLSLENVSQTSFDIRVRVIKEIAQYNDLYVEIENERKKITDGKATFTNLKRNSSYLYKFYALVNGKYIGLPITGTFNTSKEIYKIDSVISSVVQENITFKFNFTDEDKTLVNQVLVVGGKKYYAKDQTFTVPLKDFCNYNTYLMITYDLNNEEGRITINLKDYYANYADSISAVESFSNDVGAWLINILG